jgi:hypothetical protein
MAGGDLGGTVVVGGNAQAEDLGVVVLQEAGRARLPGLYAQRRHDLFVRAAVAAGGTDPIARERVVAEQRLGCRRVGCMYRASQGECDRGARQSAARPATGGGGIGALAAKTW